MLFAHDKQNPSLYEGARVAGAIESYALSQLELKVVAPEVLELAGQDVLENECGSAAICFVTFLPDILDSKKEGRNKYIEVLHTVAEKFKRNAYRLVVYKVSCLFHLNFLERTQWLPTNWYVDFSLQSHKYVCQWLKLMFCIQVLTSGVLRGTATLFMP
jgi:hypothetical protein